MAAPMHTMKARHVVSHVIAKTDHAKNDELKNDELKNEELKNDELKNDGSKIDQHGGNSGEMSLRAALQHELEITTRLLASNFPTVGGIFFTQMVGRFLAVPPTFDQVVSATLHSTTLFFIYIYVFDIANQTFSVEEDTLNKPDRPIPAGLLTKVGALKRLIASWILGPLALHLLYGGQMIIFMACFQAVVAIDYIWPRPGHWFTKNIFCATVTPLGHRLHNQVLTTIIGAWHRPTAYDVWVSFWLLSTAHVQDFHETHGDKAMGRTTMPTVLGRRGRKMVRVFTAAYLVVGSLSALVWGSYIRKCDQPYGAWVILLTGILHVSVSVNAARRFIDGDLGSYDRDTFRVHYSAAWLAFNTHITCMSVLL